MPLGIFVFLIFGCLGYLVVPIAYVVFCIWIAWRKEVQPAILPVLYATICIGLWWLVLSFGPRPFNLGSIALAALVPDIVVGFLLLFYCSYPERLRYRTLQSGILFPIALGILYLMPASLTNQQYPVLSGTPREELLPGTYTMVSDTADDMARQGYSDKSATITLLSNHTFTVTQIPDVWNGESKPASYDTFSGTWDVQKWGGSREDVLLMTVNKIAPGSTWGPSDMGYQVLKREGAYSFPINITRQRGQDSIYTLALPIMGMDDQGYLFFARQQSP